MDEDHAWRVIDAERSRLADTLERLSEREWATPSLCQAWTVRDVAAHLTLAHTGPLSATISLVRAGGSFNRMIRDTAIRQARLPVAEFPRRIRAMVGSRRTAPLLSAYEPLIDILCHSQDVARPIGRPWPMPAEAARAAAAHIWKRAFPFQAQRRLRGCRLVATDIPWAVGTGELVEGPISALLLVLSGRPAGVTELSGPGVTRVLGSFPSKAGPSRALPARPTPTDGVERMRFEVRTNASPEQVSRALTDFTDRRPRIWRRTLDATTYELIEQGEDWAVARESSPGSPFWVVARYDWSDPAMVRWKVTDSSYGGGGGGSIRISPARDGGSHLHTEWTNTGATAQRPLLFLLHHGPMGRLIARRWTSTLNRYAAEDPNRPGEEKS